VPFSWVVLFCFFFFSVRFAFLNGLFSKSFPVPYCFQRPLPINSESVLPFSPTLSTVILGRIPGRRTANLACPAKITERVPPEWCKRFVFPQFPASGTTRVVSLFVLKEGIVFSSGFPPAATVKELSSSAFPSDRALLI